jgi:hypothetical protein
MREISMVCMLRPWDTYVAGRYFFFVCTLRLWGTYIAGKYSQLYSIWRVYVVNYTGEVTFFFGGCGAQMSDILQRQSR